MSRDGRVQTNPDQINRDTGQRGKHAIETEQNQRRCVRIDSGKAKDTRDQIRIQRRLPRGGPGLSIERIGEAAAKRNRPAYAPHLPAKTKRAFDAFEFVGVGDQDVDKPQHKTHREHPEKRGSCTRPPTSRDSRHGL